MAEKEVTRTTDTLLQCASEPDTAPRSRDRVVEFAIAICIIGVLEALYLLNNAPMVSKARLVGAIGLDPPSAKTVLPETLAFEGALDSADQREFVRVANMRNGTVAGIKFLIAGDPLYVVNWQCRAATAQEVAEAVKALPDEKAAALRSLTPVELPPDHQLKTCQQGSGSAH